MTVRNRIAVCLFIISLFSASSTKPSPLADQDLYQRALQAKERGDLNEAITLLKTELARTPSHSEARFQLGLVFFELKRWKDAEDEFKKYIQLHPGSFQAHNNLAAIYAQMGMVESLARELKTVVKLQPDFAQGHANLADYYLTLAMRSIYRAYRATAPADRLPLKQKLDRVFSVNPEGPERDFILGCVARLQGEKSAAREYFSKAAQFDADYAPPKLLDEARRLVREGEPDDALDDLMAIAILDRGNPEATLMAADILVKQKKYDAAMEELQNVPVSTQKDTNYTLTMAAALRGSGQHEKAVTLLETALSRQNRPDLRRLLAEAYKANGDYTKAVAEYEKLMKTEPDPAWVQREILDLTRQKLQAAADTTSGSRGDRGVSAPAPARIPAALIVLPGNGRCVIVEKETQTLLLFRKTADGFELEKTFSCSTGVKEGEKSSEGDHKTPEGIYLFKKILPGSQLPGIYGKMAITLDYPNPFDRLEGKSGDGIWLHATNEPIRPYLPNKTRGCVVVSNNDIAELSRMITLNQTPLVIVSKLHYQTPAELGLDEVSLKNFLAQWRQNWENKAINSYIGMYSARFRNGDQNLKAYRIYKEGVFSRAGKIQLRVDLESVVRYDKYAVITFRQEYRSNRLTSTGTKRLFVVRENDAWKIIAEVMG
jgi:murein L,D-transpeptidase YafK/Tfp pilus assembly protein PilF